MLQLVSAMLQVQRVSAMLKLVSAMLQFLGQPLCIFELPTLTKDHTEYKMLKIITYPLICTKAASQACQQEEGRLGMLDSVLVSTALGECTD